MDRAIGFEHRLLDVAGTCFAALPECLSERVAGQTGAPKVPAEYPAVVHDEERQPVDHVPEAPRTGEYGNKYPTGKKQRSGADQTCSQFCVSGDHGRLDRTAEQQDDDKVNDVELRQRPVADRAQTDDEKREDGNGMERYPDEHHRQLCPSGRPT